MEIISEEEYTTLLSKNIKHLNALNDLIRRLGEPAEGNYFYLDNFKPYPKGDLKQRNLASLARVSNEILEIGVNAGHTCLVMLMANPKAKITAFDLCAHIYVKPCVEYLNQNFQNRITLIEGPSEETVSNFRIQNPTKKFDLFHIDGCHNPREANLDFFLCRALSHSNSYVVFDDTGFDHLKVLWEGFLQHKLVEEIELIPVDRLHAIGKYNKFNPLLLEEIVDRACTHVFPHYSEQLQLRWGKTKELLDLAHLDLVQPHSVIYAELTYYCMFHTFANIQVPFILITGNDDYTMPYGDINNKRDVMDQLLSSPYLIKWYTTNKDSTHYKMEYLPIGLSRNIPSINDKYNDSFMEYYLYMNSLPIQQTLEDAFPKDRFLTHKTSLLDVKLSECTTRITTHEYHNIRAEWLPIISKNFQTESTLLPWNEYMKEMGKHKFALCLPGRGLDTYRIWEALTLGVIPITCPTPLSQLYEDLPVLMVSDPNTLTPQFLENIYPSMLSKVDRYNWDKLTSTYWVEQILTESPTSIESE